MWSCIQMQGLLTMTSWPPRDHFPYLLWVTCCLSLQIYSWPFSTLLCAPGSWHLYTISTAFLSFWLPDGFSQWESLARDQRARGERGLVFTALAAALWSSRCPWLPCCREDHSPWQAAWFYSQLCPPAPSSLRIKHLLVIADPRMFS